MKKELKREWVSALRSGEYAQARGKLRDAGGAGNPSSSFCCLGVLCKIAGAEFGAEKEVLLDDEVEGEYKDLRTCTAFLAEDKWTGEEELSAGLLEHFGLSDEVSTKLMEMNDGVGEEANNARSFPEIADWIEGHDLESGKELV